MNVLAIYPTARKVEDLLKRATRESGCIMGHRVMTFPQLVDALWRESDSERPIVGTTGEWFALEEAIARTRAAGIGIEPSPGMSQHLMAFVRVLKSAGSIPADLNAAADALAPAPRSRIQTIAAVFAAYQGVLEERGLADAHDRERAVLEMIHRMEGRGGRPRLLAGVEELIVAEIYDFSVIQFMIVAALIRIVGDARLTIQAEPHRLTVSRFAELTWNRFVAEESIADRVLPQFVRRGGRSGRLGFVIENIFTGAWPEPPSADDSVAIIEAPNRLSEVEEVARAIRRKLESCGGEMALNRIAIVARDLAPYADYLKTVFRRYGIPLNLGYSPSLRAAPPARFVMDLIELPRQGYRRQALISLCNGPYASVAAGRYPEMLIEAGYIDRTTQSLADCLERRRQEYVAAIAAAGAEDRERRQRALDAFDRRARAWHDLAAIVEPLESPATAADHVARLLAALAQLGFDPAAEAHGEAAGSLWNALREIAREAATVAPDRILSHDQFAAMVESALMRTAAEPAISGISGVHALPVLDARGLDFEIVFIVGLNDGIFPLYHPEDPLVPDEVRRAINRPLAAALRRRMGANAPDAPGPILRTRYDRNGEDWFLFFLALSMPARAVVLSYALTDDRGNPALRSPFADEVIRLLGASGAGGELIRRAGGTRLIGEPEDCFTAGEFLNRAAADAILELAPVAAIADRARLASVARRIGIECGRKQYFELPAREDRGADPESGADKIALAGPYDGRVAAGRHLRRLLLENRDGGVRRWSPAQLTEFATCGFKYFAHRVLSLREQDEPDYEQSALESGDLAHELLHKLFDRGIDLSDPEGARRSALEILDQERERRRRDARDPAFFNLEWSRLRRIVEEVVAYEAGRFADIGERPSKLELEYELRFSLRDARNVAAADRIDLEIEGWIDRLEIYRDTDGRICKLRVVDYKTSRNAGRYAKALSEKEFARKDFQMPVYAMGAIEQFAGELAPAVKIEATYIVLKSREKETEPKQVDRKELETDPARRAQLLAAGVEPIAERVIGMVAEAVAGRFDVDPLDCSPYCPYRRVCRYRKAVS
jgi:superfamily I DNA/RNA helicase/RecB family exonuclease